MFQDTEIKTYVLDIYSEVFVGHNTYKKFMVWTGEGDNGKSVTTTIFEKLLGVYSVDLPTSLLTGKRADSSAATPALARTKGVRMAWLKEPAQEEKLNAGMLKELTGNDSFYARGLFQDGYEIKSMFKLVLVCNKPPVLESDKAAWNRTRILPFESVFCDDAPEDYSEQLELKKFKIDRNFEQKIPKLTEAFAWYLINHRKNKVENFVLHEPEKVLSATREYQNRNNVFKMFVSENIKKDNQHSETLADVYNTFKEWYRENFTNNKSIPNRPLFQEEMEKNIGQLNGLRWFGYKILTFEEKEELHSKKTCMVILE
jgi:P4 family phage/plasmid primase-like protien